MTKYWICCNILKLKETIKVCIIGLLAIDEVPSAYASLPNLCKSLELVYYSCEYYKNWIKKYRFAY